MQEQGKNSGLCVFGEVLYDQFPDGRRILGGAPFNVAWHLAAFGAACAADAPSAITAPVRMLFASVAVVAFI